MINIRKIGNREYKIEGMLKTLDDYIQLVQNQKTTDGALVKFIMLYLFETEWFEDMLSKYLSKEARRDLEDLQIAEKHCRGIAKIDAMRENTACKKIQRWVLYEVNEAIFKEKEYLQKLLIGEIKEKVENESDWSWLEEESKIKPVQVHYCKVYDGEGNFLRLEPDCTFDELEGRKKTKIKRILPSGVVVDEKGDE